MKQELILVIAGITSSIVSLITLLFLKKHTRRRRLRLIKDSMTDFMEYLIGLVTSIIVFGAFLAASVTTYWLTKLIRIPIVDIVFIVVGLILLGFGAVTCVVFVSNITWEFLRSLREDRAKE